MTTKLFILTLMRFPVLLVENTILLASVHEERARVIFKRVASTQLNNETLPSSLTLYGSL